MQVFISIALILGDGLYNFLKILLFTATSMHAKMKNKNPKTCKYRYLPLVHDSQAYSRAILSLASYSIPNPW